jgi:hypothetical protein
MAKAIAFATPPRYPLASRGPKPPASARPDPAGASRPPGRALACVVLGPDDLQGTVAHGRGKRRAFPHSARTDKSSSTASMAGAIAPATALRCPLASRGPKPPASARPAPGGRFSPAGSGAGLSLFPDLPVYRAPYRTGGGNAVRFLFPPGAGATAVRRACPPPPWQGPSPLPQRYGDTPPAGGPQGATAPGGCLAPAGPGAGLRCAGRDGLCRAFPRGRGKRAAFPVPARRGGGTGDSPLNVTGRPQPLPEEVLVTISPGAGVLSRRWSCDRRTEIRMR